VRARRRAHLRSRRNHRRGDIRTTLMRPRRSLRSSGLRVQDNNPKLQT
jgi:hypothetical protein